MTLKMRPINHKLAVHAQPIWSEDPDDIAFIHSVFTSCSLPYRDLKDTPAYIKTSGRASLTVSSGYVKGDDGEPEAVGLPYGPKPRLILTHAFTEAVRLRSREIPVGESLTAYLRDDLGARIDTRAMRVFRDQLKRLAHASIGIEWADPKTGKHVVTNTPPFSKLELWGSGPANQGELWPSSVTLGAEFYESLLSHAVPLDQRAISALQHSARALDIYVWLAHRLHRIKAPTVLSWHALAIQFGGTAKVETKSQMKSFKDEFMKAMIQAMQVYKGAKVEKVRGGLKLYNSPPPVKTIMGKGTDLLT
jgi:hypothetical protein